nr:4Fe-4S binding protein [Oscillospiraceae bacterium]
MGFVTDALFEKVDLKSHPVFHAEPCINRIQRRFVCTDCSDVCPKQALRLESREPIHWDRCIDCGLCVTACPARAFAPSAARRKELTEDLKSTGPVSFSCRREERSCDKRASCLAAFPWEYLAAIALYTDVVLCTGACESCPDAGRRERVQALLGTLRDFLGEERFASRVHLPDEGDTVPEAAEAPEKQMTRRGLFSGMKKTAARELAHEAARRLPFLNEENEEGLQYRRMLASAVEKDRR